MRKPYFKLNSALRMLFDCFQPVNLLLVAVFACPVLQAQVPGCASPPCSPNPVPCAHCAGTWTDNLGGTWAVTSNTTPPSIGVYNVSGTLRVPNPSDPKCPTTTWIVTGYISQSFGSSSQRGTTTAHWVGANPLPSGTCAGWTPFASIAFDGGILNNGCDLNSGTWANSNGASGTFSMTKQPADLPNRSPAETSVGVAWWGMIPTVAVFEQTIGSSKYMAGRQVYEAANGAPTDGCWFVGSPYSKYALSGGGWYVGFYFFNNKWEYDYVGITPDAITFYRNNNRTPCLMSAPQAMKIYSRDTSTYFTDTLYINLPDRVNYGVARAGAQAWRTWP